jgi:glucosamine-6-phosphate deaminase
MPVNIYKDPTQAGIASAKAGTAIIRQAIEQHGEANIILATGTSQYEMLDTLVTKDIDWGSVNLFHLDEYIGLPITHGASFRKYLIERFIQKVTVLKNVFLINGEEDPQSECLRLGKIIKDHPIDVAFAGFGENGHLAFNDPPADFETTEPYIVVTLDEDCRRQQLGEGWFENYDAVPDKAISMSVNQIMKSKYIICTIPGSRKARAVKNCLENGISNLYPASILQKHAHCNYYLDIAAAALLTDHRLKSAKS